MIKNMARNERTEDHNSSIILRKSFAKEKTLFIGNVKL